MAKIAYESRNFRSSTLEIIARAVQICENYAARGYDLTLRQLYYQFVSRAWIPNTEESYKRLGSIVNDGRLAGLIDWDHLTDRTRNLSSLAVWQDPEDILSAVASQYREDKWKDQPEYVEVWVEKEALAGVVARPANRWQVPWFSCRGYVSQSEMHAAAMRLKRRERAGKHVTVIHLGDHDPSGIDMTRDIRDRLRLFGFRGDVQRIALTMEQVEQYDPPPNPAKTTDARFEGYLSEYGDESWELDALDPDVLDTLIDETIQSHLDAGIWEESLAGETSRRDTLASLPVRWDEITEFLEEES